MGPLKKYIGNWSGEKLIRPLKLGMKLYQIQRKLYVITIIQNIGLIVLMYTIVIV